MLISYIKIYKKFKKKEIHLNKQMIILELQSFKKSIMYFMNYKKNGHF